MTLPDQSLQTQVAQDVLHPWLARSNVGDDDWWQRLKERGTPLIEYQTPHRCRVTFVWRDPEGDERHSSCRHVWLCINCLTDHHAMQPPISLIRLPGTDVWHYTVLLDARWCGSYCFIPDDGDQGLMQAQGVDGAAAPEERIQQWHALRAWWRSALPHGKDDPLNAGRRWISGRGHATSALHMPRATIADSWLRWDQGESLPDPERAATWWQVHRWNSALLENERSVWVMTTGRRCPSKRPLAVFLDGGFWTQQMPLPGALIEMTRAGQLPEATYLFIDSVDNATRRRELTCNPLFWQAVEEELLPQAQHWARFDDTPGSALVAGQSFGGLSALYAGLHWPERFGKVLAQSGSFWWPRRELMLLDTLPDDACWLLHRMEEGLGQNGRLELYLEAGRQEHLIHHVHEQLLNVLERQHHHVHYRVREGGHDALWWRDGLLSGLRWLWRELPHPPLA
ncbi:enterochelin esterase [Zymobacter sp. IVIA_5232.4 C2]|uniref:enterochelin esterase n=1 Tax=Zymobacter sp. IVIA_5232.4 C2 TaxID=3394855 RepID=UPI0039C25B5A